MSAAVARMLPTTFAGPAGALHLPLLLIALRAFVSFRPLDLAFQTAGVLDHNHSIHRC